MLRLIGTMLTHFRDVLGPFDRDSGQEQPHCRQCSPGEVDLLARGDERDDLTSCLADIDGGEDTETVPSSLDGVDYEIDLSDDNAEGLRTELADYVKAGRRTGGRKVRAASGQPTGPDERERNRAIRAWAQANGYPKTAGTRSPRKKVAVSA
jgi:hypothetical protein